MSVGTRKIDDGAVNAIKLTAAHRQKRYVFERCDFQPTVQLLSNGYGDPTAAGPNRVLFRNGLSTTYTQRGTQVILGPVFEVNDGLDVSQDQTDNNGVEHIFGALGTKGNFTYTIGTDTAFFIRVKLKIADVTGTDDLLVGFRKNEAIQANVDDYDEMAAINVNLGAVQVETILNAAATVTTVSSVTWTDGQEKSIEVRVQGRQATYYIDSTPLTAIPAYSFDNAEVVVPFFFFLQATTSPGKVRWTEVEVGPLAERNSRALAA